MNTIDLVIVVSLAIFGLIGFARGFIKEVGSLVGYFVSVWVAAHFYISVAGILRPFFVTWPIGGDLASYVAAFIGLFFITQLSVGIIVGLLDFAFKIISIVPFLKTINRSGGAVVGLIEGVLIVSVVVFMMGKYPFSPDLSQKMKTSALAPTVENIGAVMAPFFPDTTKLMPSIFDMNKMPATQMKMEDWQRMMPEKQ